MNVITGEKLQDICDIHFSIPEFQPYELADGRFIDAIKFSADEVKNGDFVYINLDIIRGPIDSKDLNEESSKTQIFKEEVDLKRILYSLSNPFSLILHNNDHWFGKEHLWMFDIPKLKKIYSQNTTITHERLVPLPIGIANSMWEWGNLDEWKTIEPLEEKDHNIYFNFTIEGGCRDVKRPDCYNKFKSLGVPWLESLDYSSYLKDLNNYKFLVSPEGNGIDCHRTWEALYLKVIPIVDRNPVTEFYSKYFPMVLVDNWSKFSLKELDGVYENADWCNYELLYFNNFKNTFIDEQ